MSLELMVFLAGIGLLLHTPWELAQTKALSTCADKPWRIRLGNCSVGIVSDVLYTLGLYYLIGWWLVDYSWLNEAGTCHYGFILLISFIGAYFTELVAQRFNWWHFNRKVPHFPKRLGGCGRDPGAAIATSGFTNVFSNTNYPFLTNKTSNSNTQTKPMEKLTFNIPDLHCEGCANRSTNILEKLDGVQQADVTFDDKSAAVEYNPDEASFEEMKEALAKANYTAKK